MRQKKLFVLNKECSRLPVGSALIISLIILVVSCNRIQKNKSHKDTPDASIEKGKQLAITIVSPVTCFPILLCLMPKPGKQVCCLEWVRGWVFFIMEVIKYPSYKHDKDLPANFYPDKPVLNSVEWQNIIDYYTALAPDSMPKQQRKNIREGLAGFQVQLPAYTYPSPGSVLLKLIPATHRINYFFLTL
jgi:hypothetical protein